MKQKITIIGAGYVGLSLACLISTKYKVVCYDTDKEKIRLINNKISPIKDSYIDKFFTKSKHDLHATLNPEEAIVDSNIVIISTPTNYNTNNDYFDTTSIESSIELVLKYNKTVNIAIKSTIPIGYTDSLRKKYNKKNIFFSPEFLRETKALYDNLFPARIIVGSLDNDGKEFGDILKECAEKKDIPLLQMQSKEAEAVKLFSNTYLALRISYYNELDSFCEINKIETKKIIDGMSCDPRIGNYYNNPSFGYGGYCLPKDTKQLLGNFKNIPNNIVRAVVDSNQTRKRFIADSILKNKPKVVGIYRLIMKENSDNYRESAILDIIEILRNEVDILIYEPTLKDKNFMDLKVVKSFQDFVSQSDLILANRISYELEKCIDKVYTRDIFSEN